MLDVVPNHMASDNTAETIDYGLLNPFNEKSYFHSICWITDWNNQTEVDIVRSRLLSLFFLRNEVC